MDNWEIGAAKSRRKYFFLLNRAIVLDLIKVRNALGELIREDFERIYRQTVYFSDKLMTLEEFIFEIGMLFNREVRRLKNFRELVKLGKEL